MGEAFFYIQIYIQIYIFKFILKKTKFYYNLVKSINIFNYFLTI